MQKHYLACDLGAESGRLVHGSIAEERLSITEIHRFPNRPIRTGNSIQWNIPELFDELTKGLSKAAAMGHPYSSISCDSWGVDYLLFDENSTLMTPVFHYRDPRTQKGMDRTIEKIVWPTIFSETGIQLMPINTLFQLAAEEPGRLEKAQKLLGVGDGFNFMLGANPVIEISMASTFQLYNPATAEWSGTLRSKMGFPSHIFPAIVPSGSRIGKLKAELQEMSGLGELDIVATCSHDTGAAVAAVPAEGQAWAYLSSGTWSLMGVERPSPILSDSCRDLNFTNEIGYGNTIRLLKNISGLWLLQESRRVWSEQGNDLDYRTLTQLAKEAAPFQSMIDPTDARFVVPSDMTDAIRSFCRETHQAEPKTPGEITRCILESLALLYRRTIQDLETLTGDSIDTLHVVGGGSKNELLNQLSANATQRQVLAGPVEATAAGNIIIQALALGHLKDLQAARKLVRQSSDMKTYHPRDKELWEEANRRFEQVQSKRASD